MVALTWLCAAQRLVEQGKISADEMQAIAAKVRADAPPPAPRTDRTRLVPPPVLIGYAASYPPY